MQTIAIYHNKGGVGKTTTAINLAAAFRKMGQRVLLIDLDSQANSSFGTGLVKFQFEEEDDLVGRNVYQLLESVDFNFIPDLVRKSSGFNQPEIDVIPAHISLIEKQSKLSAFVNTRWRLDKKIQQVKDDYDIVILDAPPARDLYAEIALIAADYLIIPSDMKPFANQGLNNVKSFISEVNETRSAIDKSPLEVLGVLASKILPNTRYLTHTFPRQRDSVINRYGFPILETIIYERVSLAHCVNQTISVGMFDIPNPTSIFEFDEACESAKEFRSLAQEVMNKLGV
ncbi:AAA family ATPase [Phormidium sp. FACHB-1136]|uniref:ParA family protein n=1 Tax=Phormidium sp. FACHB-1136 TaxID=2692848 RepID=UPI00168676B4|nr:AAA family ATPase [Phormidium sp. FACHB-1136]MBD2424824.1 ParA family protein [Phormidium sp. FACHB-1136]